MFSSKPKFTPGVPFEVQRVYDLLNPKPKELLINAATRRFVAEGEVGVFNHKERRTKRRHLFLFNDLLLITKKEGKKSFWLKILIALTPNLRVEDVPDSATLYKVEFRIYALKKTIILFTQTENEKLKWLQQLRDCIGGAPKNQSSYDPSEATSYSESPEDRGQKDADRISGDIGRIDIPGMDNSSYDVGFVPDDGGYESDEYNPEYSGQNSQPFTPNSTPVQPSGFDEFDSIASRGAPPPPPQEYAPELPAGRAPAFDPFASSQPLEASPYIPSSTSVLQPIPANSSPAYVGQSVSGDFGALKSLDTNPSGFLPQQQPEQMFSQGFNPNLSVEEQMQRLSMASPFYRGN